LCSSALRICCWLCTTRYSFICVPWLRSTLQRRSENTHLVAPASSSVFRGCVRRCSIS
jgi:hypothetical protein